MWRSSCFEEIDFADMVQPSGGRHIRHGRLFDMVQDVNSLENFDMTLGRSGMRARYVPYRG